MRRAGHFRIERGGRASGRARSVFLSAALVLSALIAAPSFADVGPPAHLKISEREPGVFVTQWRIPRLLPQSAAPVPELPETCRRTGEDKVEEQAVAWLFSREWRCDGSLAGKSVGLRYPYADLALTTVIRVDLLSGDRFAHLLAPGEGSWRLPEGTVAPDPLRAASRAVLAGVSHVFESWAHLPFVLTIALLGGVRRSIRVVSAFTLGQLSGAIVPPAANLGMAPAEIGLALAAALLAREALRREENRTRLHGLAAAGGVVHGMALAAMLTDRLGDGCAGLVARLLAVLGSDAAHLTAAFGIVMLCGLATPIPAQAPLVMRRLIVYAAGATGIALALSLATGGGNGAPAVASFTPPSPPQAGMDAPAAGGGSRRIAPAASDAPLQSFLAVEPFEVRHETMLRLARLPAAFWALASSPESAAAPGATIEVTAQAALTERLAARMIDGVTVRVDGKSVPGVLRRADFMSVDATGALPRVTPVPESVAEAVVGVVVAYPVRGMPRDVSLTWNEFPEDGMCIPATVIDPESVVTVTLSHEEASLRWTNTLSEDPIPTVEAVTVEPVRVPVPLISLPLLAIASILMVVGLRRRRAEDSLTVVRVILALAILAGPLAQTAVALPGSSGRMPTEGQARRILAGLLPNIYRAMEFRNEEVIYDHLAVSVTGEQLTEVYLEQRRTLEMEERGGAQARVETVEVLAAREIASQDAGFTVRSEWTVGGMVTHFGHRHFRQNRYDARLAIVPVDGAWKIKSIEMLELERTR